MTSVDAAGMKKKKNRLYERGYLGNYQRKIIGTSYLDSVALSAEQGCYAKRQHPQTAQACGTH